MTTIKPSNRRTRFQNIKIGEYFILKDFLIYKKLDAERATRMIPEGKIYIIAEKFLVYKVIFGRD